MKQKLIRATALLATSLAASGAWATKWYGGDANDPSGYDVEANWQNSAGWPASADVQLDGSATINNYTIDFKTGDITTTGTIWVDYLKDKWSEANYTALTNKSDTATLPYFTFKFSGTPGSLTSGNIVIGNEDNYCEYLVYENGTYNHNNMWIATTYNNGGSKNSRNRVDIESAATVNTTGDVNVKGGGAGFGGDIVVKGALNVGGQVKLANGNAAASATMTVDGGTVTANSYSCIGMAGTGTVSVVNGGSYTQATNPFIVGQGSGTGTAVIDGGTLTLTGVATPNYIDGATALYIAENAAGTGTMQVKGDSTVTINGKSIIGINGKGELDIEGGYVKATNEMRVGGSKNGDNQVAGDGVVNVSGGVLDASGLTIARVGLGEVNVSGSGIVTNTTGTMYVGYATGTTGTVSVADSGSLFVTGSSHIGEYGTGKLIMIGGTFEGNGEIHVGAIANNSSTGIVEIAGGTLTAKAKVHLGAASGAASIFNMTDGTINANTEFNLGIAGSTCDFNQSGGTINIGALSYWAADNGTKTTANISGGTMNINGKVDVLNNNGVSEFEMNVTGDGVVNATKDFTLGSKGGSGSKATITVADGGTFNSYSSGGLWFIMNEAGSADTTVNINEGGFFKAWHFERKSTTGTATINFDGGTMVAVGHDNNYSRYLLGNTDSSHTVEPNVYVKSKGAIIQCDVDHVINLALQEDANSTGGGLTKTGAGSLTLNIQPTYTGATRVEEGTLILPTVETVTAWPTAVVLAGGSITKGNYTLPSVTVDGGEYAYSALPETTAATYAVTGGEVTFPADSTSVSLTKPLAISGGELVVELDSTTAEGITAGSTVTIAGATFSDTGTIRITGAVYDWDLTQDNGTVTATAKVPTDATNYWLGGVSGDYSDPANWKYGVPQAGQTVEIDNDVWIWIDGVGQGDNAYPMGNIVIASGKTLTIGGKTTANYPEVAVSSITGGGTFKLQWGGLRNVKNSDLTISSAVILAGNSARDAWVHGANGTGTITFDSTASLSVPEATNVGKVFANVVVNCPITGAGKLYLDGDDLEIYGDNSGFTGTVEKTNKAVKFCAAQAGFSNASATKITGTLWLWFDSGTIAFGGNTTMTAQQWAKGINVPSTVSAITLQLGGNNGAVSITTAYSGSNYSVYVQNGDDWTAGSDKVTIVKTGTGDMQNGMVNTYNFQANGGVTTFTQDNASAAISVASSATICGNVTIGYPTFASGAIIKTTASKTADEVEEGAEQTYTYALTKLTYSDSTNIDLTGVQVVVDNDSDLADAPEGTILGFFQAVGLSNWTITTNTLGSADWEMSVVTTGELGGSLAQTLSITKCVTVVPQPAGFDPEAGKLEATVEFDNSGSLEGDELTAAVVDAAVAANLFTIPTGVTGVDAETYASYFKYTLDDAGEGSYTLTIAGIDDDVEADVDAEAVAALVAGTAGESVEVAVKPGLYYGFSAASDLDDVAAKPELNLAIGTTMTFTKPDSTTQGFTRVVISPKDTYDE